MKIDLENMYYQLVRYYEKWERDFKRDVDENKYLFLADLEHDQARLWFARKNIEQMNAHGINPDLLWEVAVQLNHWPIEAKLRDFREGVTT